MAKKRLAMLTEEGGWTPTSPVALAEATEKPLSEYTSGKRFIGGESIEPKLGTSEVGTKTAGMQTTAPTIMGTQAKNIILNPDGSALIKTILELNQLVPGFSAAVAQAQTQAGANKRYGQ